jgi:4-hydroxybenzoate polyprenyltransferase
MRFVLLVFHLIRVDATIAAFLAIFLPSYTRTSDLSLSLKRAVPLLFICICTFVANDLNDMERDEINHPQRPLAASRLAPTVAAMLFFVSLFAALFSTHYFAAPSAAFWYYALISVSISYSLLVDWLPSLKAPYVAAAETVPILITLSSYPSEPRIYGVAIAVLFHSLGREICKDIADRPGDGVSFVRTLRPRPLAAAAFLLQVVPLVTLSLHSHSVQDYFVVATMTLCIAFSSINWFILINFDRALVLLKLTLFLGLYFLL